jgi:hypothetical protein
MNEDIGSRLFDIFILPGDVVVHLLVTYAPSVATLFKLGRDDLGGTLSITVAVLAWLAAIMVTGTALSKLRELDRRLTDHVAAGYREIQRLIRVLKRRIATSFAARSTAKTNDEDLVVDAIALEGVETAVLRCLACIDDGAVLSTDDIAAQIRRPQREVMSIVQRLIELEMIKPGFDSFSNKDGHRISTAGQMYLLGT